MTALSRVTLASAGLSCCLTEPYFQSYSRFPKPKGIKLLRIIVDMLLQATCRFLCQTNSINKTLKDETVPATIPPKFTFKERPNPPPPKKKKIQIPSLFEQAFQLRPCYFLKTRLYLLNLISVSLIYYCDKRQICAIVRFVPSANLNIGK